MKECSCLVIPSARGGFGKSYQNTYLFWVNHAKREETKKKRMQIVLERAKKNMPPGLG